MRRKQQIIQSKTKKYKNKLDNEKHEKPSIYENVDIMNKIVENTITVLINLDTESNQPNITTEEYDKLGTEITKILNKFEEKFGLESMLNLFAFTSKKLGHTLGPLEQSIMDKLTSVIKKEVSNIK